MKLNLEDLRPQEATFELSDYAGKKYTLRKFSLAVQIWINQRFGKDKLSEIFANTSLPEISEIIYYLLKDKTDFPTLESLQEAIVTQGDRVSLINALIASIGISQPMIEKLGKEYDEGNEQSLSQPTGAQSTTS